MSLLINFLLGASWAFAFMGAVIFFYLFLHVGILYSILGSFLGAIPGLFLVLLIEYFIMRQEKFDELKKQTKLLEKLVEQKES